MDEALMERQRMERQAAQAAEEKAVVGGWWGVGCGVGGVGGVGVGGWGGWGVFERGHDPTFKGSWRV